ATWRKLRYSRRVDVKAGCCRGGATPGTPTQVRSVVASEVQDAEGREYCRGGAARRTSYPPARHRRGDMPKARRKVRLKFETSLKPVSSATRVIGSAVVRSRSA